MRNGKGVEAYNTHIVLCPVNGIGVCGINRKSEGDSAYRAKCLLQEAEMDISNCSAVHCYPESDVHIKILATYVFSLRVLCAN